MAKKKNWLGMAAALLAFGSVLVSCGSKCLNDGECSAKVGDSPDSVKQCKSLDCAVEKQYGVDRTAETITKNASCDC